MNKIAMALLVAALVSGSGTARLAVAEPLATAEAAAVEEARKDAQLSQPKEEQKPAKDAQLKKAGVFNNDGRVSERELLFGILIVLLVVVLI